MFNPTSIFKLGQISLDRPVMGVHLVGELHREIIFWLPSSWHHYTSVDSVGAIGYHPSLTVKTLRSNEPKTPSIAEIRRPATPGIETLNDANLKTELSD